MFSLGEISEQLKDVSRKSVGVSFAGQSLILDTANDGKIIEFIYIYFFDIFSYTHIYIMYEIYIYICTQNMRLCK